MSVTKGDSAETEPEWLRDDAAIYAKVHVDHDYVARMKFAHSNQTQIGEIGIAIGLFFGQLSGERRDLAIGHRQKHSQLRFSVCDLAALVCEATLPSATTLRWADITIWDRMRSLFGDTIGPFPGNSTRTIRNPRAARRGGHG